MTNRFGTCQTVEILRAALDEIERTQGSDDGLPTSVETSSSLTPVMPYLSRTGSEFDELMAEMGTGSRLGSRPSTRESSVENADRMSSTPIGGQPHADADGAEDRKRSGDATPVLTHRQAAAAPLLDSMPLVRVKRFRHR